MGMHSNPLPPITLLVKSSETAPLDGAAHLFHPKDPDISGVHVVSKEEVFGVVDEWKHNDPERRHLVSGIALMQQAVREKDLEEFRTGWTRFQKALDAVKLWVPHWSDADLTFIRESHDWRQAAWAYSGLMSNLLQTAQFIMWCPTNTKGEITDVPRLGLYCHDWEVAVYAGVGMDNIRFCRKPGCGNPFIPRVSADPDSDQKYCPGGKCANAARVAKWKAAHPRRAKQQRAKKSLRQCTGKVSGGSCAHISR